MKGTHTHTQALIRALVHLFKLYIRISFTRSFHSGQFIFFCLLLWSLVAFVRHVSIFEYCSFCLNFCINTRYLSFFFALARAICLLRSASSFVAFIYPFERAWCPIQLYNKQHRSSHIENEIYKYFLTRNNNM